MNDPNPILIDAIYLGDLFGEIDSTWKLPELEPFELPELEPLDLDALVADFDPTPLDDFFVRFNDPALQKWMDDLMKQWEVIDFPFDFDADSL